jgi:predicted lipoprotein with Yx(FWY)xxD motif/mono/diheme cytochrome c family protein
MGLARHCFRMILPRMSRPAKVFLSGALLAVMVLGTACGTQKISVPKSQAQLYQGAVLFNQRCSGCHTLSYAATHGSAQNVRTAQFNNGPNFDIRCERPVARVLYAIQNGGFSGVVMPQNIVVGQDAVDVAKFVATYSGRKAPKIPGTTPCQSVPVGTVAEALAPISSTPTSTGPSPGTLTSTTSTSTTSTSTTPTTATSASGAGNQTVTISSRTVPGLGTILVNSAGHTLYAFAPDKASKVTCTGGCAAVWPPAMVPPGRRVVGTRGVKASLLGSAPDPTGGRVITYNGWPLYTYVADAAPGSEAGENVNLNGGLWWVITTAGAVVRKRS